MGCTFTSKKVNPQKTIMMESTFNIEQRDKEQHQYRQTKTMRKQVKLQSDVKDALQEQLYQNNTAQPQKFSLNN